MADKDGFIARCREAQEAAQRMQNPLIVHHYDCDGISSGSLVAQWFESQGLVGHVTVTDETDYAASFVVVEKQTTSS